MVEKLQYESGFDRAREVHVRRRVIWRRVFVGLGILLVVICIAVVLLIYAISQDGIARIKLTVTNGTPIPITDIGFDDYNSDRVLAFGPIAPGQTKTFSRDYNENDCPTGLSYDQAGQTLYVRLSGEAQSGDYTYTVTVAQNNVTSTWMNANAVTKMFLQIPSTQPIVYLDQNGKPVPIRH